MKCPKCGTERIGNGIYCTQCEYVYSDQTPDVVHYLPLRPEANMQRKKRCSACKTPVSEDATACPSCGAMFVEHQAHAIASESLSLRPGESPSDFRLRKVREEEEVNRRWTNESSSRMPPPQKEPGYERRYVSDSRAVSTAGGVILLFALLLLVAAWAWQEDLQSQLENGDISVSEYKDWSDSVRNAGRLWNLGVTIAVLGATVVAFAQVRK